MSCFFYSELQSNPNLSAGQAVFNQHQYAEAFQLLLPLAHQGNVVAQCMLGSMFQVGLGVEQDLAAAKIWYLQAGSQGCALSFHNLTTIFSVNERNPELTKYYYQQARNIGFN